VKSTTGSFVTLTPGDQLTAWDNSFVYQQAAEPVLETVGIILSAFHQIPPFFWTHSLALAALS